MPAESDPFVALEIGTSKVRALVGQARMDDHLVILGLGESPSQGVRKGEITNFNQALLAVRTALQLAEENSGVDINQVCLLVSGGHVRSDVHHGSVSLYGRSTVTEDDVEHVMETARAMNLPTDRVIMHSICQNFYVDGQQGVLDPLGLEGSKLDLDMLIIHALRARTANHARLVKEARVDMMDVAFSGLCAALAVLTPDDKQHGVTVINLGGGTTDYLSYAGSTIAAAGSYGVGGDHLTNDLSVGLRLQTHQAEEMKEEHGSAIVDLANRGKRIEIASEGGVSRRFVRLGDIHMITNNRIDETLGLVKGELERRRLLHRLGAGVVFTGGGSYLKNVVTLGEKIFGVQCRLGIPRNISGLSTAVEGPEYAAPVGMLKYAIRSAVSGSYGRVPLLEKLKGLLGMSS